MNEKSDQGMDQLERRISQESTLSHQSHIDAFTPEEQRKIIRRVDFRLVTTLGFMYCVSLMDRTNLGIAVVGGMGAGEFTLLWKMRSIHDADHLARPRPHSWRALSNHYTRLFPDIRYFTATGNGRAS